MWWRYWQVFPHSGVCCGLHSSHHFQALQKQISYVSKMIKTSANPNLFIGKNKEKNNFTLSSHFSTDLQNANISEKKLV